MYFLYLLGASFSAYPQIFFSNAPITNEKHALNNITDKSIFTEKEQPSKKPVRIVIDPGHGGHDTGCTGKHIEEKDLVLNIGLQLGEVLKIYNPDIEVYYTRTRDVFVPLRKRIQQANDLNADLFISIHANQYKDKQVHGAEVYVMGLHAARENLEVAKRENASILLENNYSKEYEGYVPDSAEEEIIMSMFQNLFLESSIQIARAVGEQIGVYTPVASRGVKQAGFVVLRNASMPSILVELGFLSNDGDSKYLSSPEGQKQTALALARAVDNYFRQTHPAFAAAN